MAVPATSRPSGSSEVTSSGSPSRTLTYQVPPPSPVTTYLTVKSWPIVHSGSIRYGKER